MNLTTEMRKGRESFKTRCKICLSIMTILKSKKMMHRFPVEKARLGAKRSKRKEQRT